MAEADAGAGKPAVQAEDSRAGAENSLPQALTPAQWKEFDERGCVAQVESRSVARFDN